MAKIVLEPITSEAEYLAPPLLVESRVEVDGQMAIGPMVPATMMDIALHHANVGRLFDHPSRKGRRVFPLQSPKMCDACASKPEGQRVPDLCRCEGKKPIIKAWQAAATTDVNMVWRWWSEHPEANVGLACGEESGVFVVDLDGTRGVESWRALLAKHGCEGLNTHAVRTSRGGVHLYFEYPDVEDPIRNSASKIGRNIDIRGEGGYVLAAGSIHPLGDRYEVIEDSGDVEQTPEWLLDLVRAEPERARQERAPAPPLDRDVGPWARQALLKETVRVSTAEPGTRNHTLYEAALKLGSIVGGGHLEEATVVAKLEEAAVHCGLDDAEIDATIKSGIENGIENPRHPAPSEDGPASRGDPTGPKVMVKGQASPFEDFDEDTPCDVRPDWVVPGFWEVGHRFVVTGDPGVGKMTFLRHLACSIAAGVHPFAAEEMDPQRVLILDLQEGTTELARRLPTITDTFTTDENQIRREHFKLRTLPEGMDLFSVEDTRMVEDLLGEWKPRLVVLGPAYRAFTAPEANENGFVRQLTQLFDRWIRTHDFALLVEAHNTSSKRRGRDTVGVVAGSSIWERWADHGVCLENMLDRDDIDADVRGDLRIARLRDWRYDRRTNRPVPAFWTNQGERVWQPLSQAAAEDAVESLVGGQRIGGGRKSSGDSAARWLVEYLDGQPGKSATMVDVDAAAKRAGYAPWALRRAKDLTVPDKIFRKRDGFCGQYSLELAPRVSADQL